MIACISMCVIVTCLVIYSDLLENIKDEEIDDIAWDINLTIVERIQFRNIRNKIPKDMSSKMEVFCIECNCMSLC